MSLGFVGPGVELSLGFVWPGVELTPGVCGRRTGEQLGGPEELILTTVSDFGGWRFMRVEGRTHAGRGAGPCR